jgi:DNA-binding NtrC family response regulator
MSDDSNEARVRLNDLPASSADPVQYRVIVRTDEGRRAQALSEGETVMGRAERCDVQIQAAGLRARHLCLKRNGDRVFVRTIGSAEARHDENALGAELRPVILGAPIAFGTATAVVRRVEPDDRTAAVDLSGVVAEGEGASVPVRERLGDEAGQVREEAARQLQALNDALARGVQNEGPLAECALDGLHECLAPSAAALFRRAETGTGPRWACMAVHGRATPPAPSNASDEWTIVRGPKGYALVARLPDADPPPWQAALCRHLVLLVAHHESASAAGEEAAARSPTDEHAEGVWDSFVGQRVREHLRAHTKPCRYAHSVLVLGETGTGKELAARALHRQVWQREGPLVALNCAAVPEDLLEAELFGVEQGAATGVDARPGRFEQAQQGTLVLDEIAEMPMVLQSKLLRVLEERTYVPLGGTDLREAQVRVVAASNRPESALRSGDHMRSDLYFRLAQATLVLPPLRNRIEDLPALCEHFLSALEREYGRGVKGLSRAALQPMMHHSWSGNVRELKNVLRTVYARTPSGELATRRHLPRRLRESNAPTAEASPSAPEATRSSPPDSASGPSGLNECLDASSLAAVVETAERWAIRRALRQNDRVADAAEALDLSTSYLYRKIKKLDLDPATIRQSASE